MKSHKLSEQERRIICAGGTAQLSKIYKSHYNRQLARFAQMRGLLIAPDLWEKFCEVYGFATEARPEPAPLFDEEELGYEIKNGEAVKEYPESKEEQKLAPKYPRNYTEALLGAILTEVKHIRELLVK